MFRNLLVVAIAASISTVSTVVLAQNANDYLPKPNRQGDYNKGKWREWIVVDRDRSGLNCRSGAGSNYRAIKKFYNNDRVYVFTQGEYDLIQRDQKGKPWLAVLPTGYQYEEPCFVRANKSFIQPLPQE